IAPRANPAVAVEATPVPPPPTGPDDKPRWKSEFEAGASAAWGNNDDRDVRVRFASTRVAPDNTLKLDSLYHFATSHGKATSNSFTAGALSDWPVPASRWSYFAQGRFDYDDFVSWDYRVSAAGGVGYRLLEVQRAGDDG